MLKFKQHFIHRICVLLLLPGFSAYSQRLTGYVDPLIGSGGHGHVFVGANVPFGAVQVGPSNFFKGWDWCSGYSYRDSVIIGFPQLHLSGTGIGDLGDILIMPYMGEVKLSKGLETQRFSGYSSKFSHQNEKVRPGYYSVKLDDYGIDVELTATERVGFHKYKFPQKENARIIIDLSEGINDKSTDTYIELTDPYTIKGYRSSSGWAKKQQVFFAVKSSVPFKNFLVFDNTQKVEGKKGKGESIKGLITFEKAPAEISLKVGISPVSAENALANIQAEIPGWDFDKIKNRALDLWEKELAKIEIETENDADKRVFYTSLYHAMMHPSLFNDHNGDYMGSDWKVYRKAPFNNYTIFSLWDTYRAAHPLFTITNPNRVGDFVNSMIAIFEQTGALPIWHLRGYDTGTMVGINSFQVIAEAYLKGIKGFDAKKAYNALKTTAMSDLRGMDYVRDLKPIPYDVMRNRPVATALETAIGDACIALMAKKLGKTADYEYFKKRAENYKLYYDKEVGFFRGKKSDGAWNPVFDPLKSKRPYATDYAEGNAWQYLWLVPQDVNGLIEFLGGETAFLDRLDQFFALDSDPNDPDVLIDLTGLIGQYAHGNEPSHHIAYLYAYAGQQWKTARLTRKIMTKFYHDQPDGLIGNEDCGQMSAWYVLSSLGFYPVLTASGDYVFGSPLFDKATIHLENGKKFTVEATNNSPENKYIQSAELNGKNYPFTFISHKDILAGGVLKFTMGKEPNYQFGKDPVYRPHDSSLRQGSTLSQLSPQAEPVMITRTRQSLVQTQTQDRPFVHPGMSQTAEDLAYMKQQVKAGKEPWKTAFENLKKATSLDFKPDPFTHISVGPYGANSIGGRQYERSANAAYDHALMWYLTDDKRYADKAIEILNAWSYRLWDFDANNAKLNVGLFAPSFLNAAEILRYTDSGWNEKDIEQFERLTMTVFYPTIKDFFTEANGNWDASIIHTMFCIGVFTDNPEIFNRGLERFYYGPNNSGITKYIYPTGQCQETTRDWGHVQLGIGEFGKAAQVAWTQGIDLYSVADDRLALGYEYMSKYLLGGEIPVFGVLSERDKDKFRDIYESIFNHYKTVKGIELPYTKDVIEKHTRPKSSLALLTALRAPLGHVPATTKQSIQPDSKAKSPLETGALTSYILSTSDGTVIVRPGESIQEAIDKNKRVVLAKGVHTLKEPLKMQSGVTLSGEGKETILFLSPGLSATAIINATNDLHDVTIRDFLLEGASTVKTNDDPNHDRRNRSYMSAPSREGILFAADRDGEMKNIRFENLTVQNCTKSGVSVKGASGVKVINCDFSDNGASVVPGAGFHHNLLLTHVSDGEIRNSRFDTSPWGSGMDITFCRNILVTGNEAARNALSGIRCADSEHITITGNLTEGNDQEGIFLDVMKDVSKAIEINDNLSRLNGQKEIFIPLLGQGRTLSQLSKQAQPVTITQTRQSLVQTQDNLKIIGRGTCQIENGSLVSKDAYACFGDSSLTDYSIQFRAQTPASEEQVQIWGGFRHYNRFDRYIFGMKGGLSDEIYLSRMGYMGKDELLAVRNLDFHPEPGQWYDFKIIVCGNRIQLFINNETQPRIDVTDRNANLAPGGQVTLGGGWLKTLYNDLVITPLPSNYLANVEKKEYAFGITAQEKASKRQKERAEYKAIAVKNISPNRTEISLDGKWLFMPEYETPDNAVIVNSENDESWHIMTVPNFWNPIRIWLHGETFGPFPKGVSDKYYRQETERCENYTFDFRKTKAAWYRQWIELPENITDKQLELHFDAVSKVAEVYINGTLAGNHIGMFGDFKIDGTKLFKPGKNRIDVKVTRDFVKNIDDADKVVDVAVTVPVTNRMLNDLAHGFYGDNPAGIWQPVGLTISPALKIEDVYIKPGLTGADFEVTVKNHSGKKSSIGILTDIIEDETGNLFYSSDMPFLSSHSPNVKTELKAGEEKIVKYSIKNLKPRLWTPQHPNLYRFQFKLTSGDQTEVLSGFRTFEVKNGLFELNGVPYWLRGGNHTPFALAPNDLTLANTFYQLMKAGNIEITRTHTTPYNELWIAAADRNGIGISHEGTWPWLMINNSMPAKELLELWKSEYLHMLKKYRNHPSILFWTINNEMKFYDLEPDFEKAKEKMRIISDVVREMRKIDPTRPVSFDSNYRRNVKKFGEEFYATIDDGDIDDVHSYINWYDHTIFKYFKGEFQKSAKNPGRPLISQELSTGYPNNETGHPTRFYNLVHQNPQTLVGYKSYEFADPAYFLKVQSFITGELAEALRRSNDEASGFMHFALLTWFRNVYDAQTIEPYPTYYALKRALQPVLVSAELWGRHFYAGETLPAEIYIVNDRENGKDLKPSRLYWELCTENGEKLTGGTLETPEVKHYKRQIVKPLIQIPAELPNEKTLAKLKLRLTENGASVSENEYEILLTGKTWSQLPANEKKISLTDFDGTKQQFDFLHVNYTNIPKIQDALKSKSRLLVFSGLDNNCSEAEAAQIRDYVLKGGKVLLLNSKETVQKIFPEYITGYFIPTEGDIANMEIPESEVFDGIDELELRYFNNNKREIPIVCYAAMKINRNEHVTELANHTKIHGYISGDMEQRANYVEQIKGFPLLEIKDGGTVLISTMTTDKAGTDPVAGKLLTNMINHLLK